MATAHATPAQATPQPAEGSTTTQQHPMDSTAPTTTTTSDNIATFTDFRLESGAILPIAQCAYRTWGTLRQDGTNVLVLCHAMTGSADAADWWGPLLGPGRAFDTNVFFIFCANVLGSPYGSSSPLQIDPTTGKPYGPTFPTATIRDDVRLHRMVLDQLGVTQIQHVIGGSMGGMQALEWAFFGTDYVRNIIPIATSGRHSAWCISWSEAQRQTIYSDPNYKEGYYDAASPPNAGLAAARMQALLTYRSRNSFESRFGRSVMRKEPDSGRGSTDGDAISPTVVAPTATCGSGDESDPIPSTASSGDGNAIYSAQSYLRYQGDKFVKRFDANCYVTITRKMDAHDLSRGRGGDPEYFNVLRSITQPALVIGIESDSLFTLQEQRELAAYMPNSRLAVIDSHEGHDGFLIEFVLMNKLIIEFIHEKSSEYFNTKQQSVVKPATDEEVKELADAQSKDFLNW